MNHDQRGDVPALHEPPAALRAVAELVLDSPFPAALLWGVEPRLLPNDPCTALAGLPPVAAGRPVAEAWPELWTAVADAVEAVRAGGRALRLDGRPLPAAGGSAAVCTLALTPARGEDGVATAVVLTILEGPDARAGEQRRRTQDALGESETRFHELADAMPQLVWTALPDGTVDYYNGRVEEFSGFQQRADGSWSWSPVLHPDDLERTAEAWSRALRSGGTYDVEHRVRRRDGSWRWYLSRAVPARDASSRVVRWYGTATDIHDQKQAEAALREEDRRKNEFLAMLSHELRNPLAPIRNSVYVLERAPAGGEQAQRARAVIERQVHHLTRLVDDLLDLTRISRGKIRLQPEPLELDALLRRAAEDQRESFARAGVAIELQLEPGPLRAVADRTRIAQAIGNLLHNAAKFTPRGGRARLSLRRGPAGDAVVSVGDSGVGMTPEVLGQLFQPFVQAERTLDRSRGGLGLGLALARRLVELHGGSVSAASEGPGRGSEFTLRLPLDSPVPQPALRADLRRRPETARRVLVIEDNVDAAESLREALELGDHQVEVALDGREGVAKARAFTPEIVLCDIGLPGLDGYGVARALRADPLLRDTCLVALSGYGLQEDVDRARAAGFDRHLVKPPDVAELERVLAELTSRGGAAGSRETV